MSEPQCEGCGKRPEVYGSSWCALCHDSLSEYTKERILTMRNTLGDIASGELGINLCIKYAQRAIVIPDPTPAEPK